MPDAQNKKADGFGFRPPSYSRGVDPLRHFDDSLQLRATFTVRCARILGAQQARCDPQSVHLFADPQQFLFLHSQYVVRIFHWGRASPANSDWFRLLRNTVSQSRTLGKLPQVHPGLGIKSLENGADWPLPRYHQVNVPNDRDDS